MNCQSFQDRIERFVAGELSPAEMAAASAHTASCPDCAAAARIFAGDMGKPVEPEMGAFEADRMAGAILRQTSGSTCRTVHEKLCPLQDGELDESDAWLVRGHLEHCEGCTAVARALSAIDAPLAAMASLPLDDGFTEDVMAATIHASRDVEAASWRARLIELWSNVHRRPRFAVEFAYVATVLLVLLTGTPSSPLKHMPGQALTWLQGNVAASSDTGDPQGAEGRLVSGWNPGIAVPQPVRDFGSRVKGDLTQDLGARKEQMVMVWSRFGGHRQELTAAARDRDLGRVGLALEEIGCDLKLFWRGLRKRISGPEALVC